MQAVGFTSVCSTWCRGRGQSGAVISWYAAVRNEARARRMMLRGDDFWQFASNTGRLVEHIEIGLNKEDKKPGDNVHKKWWFDMKKLFFN